uniref:BIG2 domain-containing protein n=1 Tax=Noccaea caerulescens TaxID=107243 RepID=A0A1J3FYN3_NOCCA
MRRLICGRLAVCILVMAMLYVGGPSASNEDNKNPSDIVRITLNRKPMIFLQWTPHVSQEIKLNVRGGGGGCGNVTKWGSSNRRIVDVSSYGVIQGKSPGIATVRAVSTCDPQSFDEIVVKVFASDEEDVCYDMDDMEPPIYESLECLTRAMIYCALFCQIINTAVQCFAIRLGYIKRNTQSSKRHRSRSMRPFIINVEALDRDRLLVQRC